MKREAKYLLAALVFLLAVVLLSGVISSFIMPHKTAQRYACINNLRMIDSVQSSAAPLANAWAEGDIMDPAQCVVYLKGGAIPSCPSGGEYALSWIVGGPYPSCTIHGAPLQELLGDRKLEPGVRRNGESEKDYDTRITEHKISGRPMKGTQQEN